MGEGGVLAASETKRNKAWTWEETSDTTSS